MVQFVQSLMLIKQQSRDTTQNDCSQHPSLASSLPPPAINLCEVLLPRVLLHQLPLNIRCARRCGHAEKKSSLDAGILS